MKTVILNEEQWILWRQGALIELNDEGELSRILTPTEVTGLAELSLLKGKTLGVHQADIREPTPGIDSPPRTARVQIEIRRVGDSLIKSQRIAKWQNNTLLPMKAVAAFRDWLGREFLKNSPGQNIIIKNKAGRRCGQARHADKPIAENRDPAVCKCKALGPLPGMHHISCKFYKPGNTPGVELDVDALVNPAKVQPTPSSVLPPPEQCQCANFAGRPPDEHHPWCAIKIEFDKTGTVPTPAQSRKSNGAQPSVEIELVDEPFTGVRDVEPEGEEESAEVEPKTRPEGSKPPTPEIKDLMAIDGVDEEMARKILSKIARNA